MNAFLLNGILALLWLLLSGNPSLLGLGVGYLLGFALLALAQPLFPRSRYVSRALAFVRFLLLFLREFLVANLKVARAVLWRPVNSLCPGFLRFDIAGLRPGEAILLSHCVTLTPGTTTVEISDDGKTLIFHTLDASDPEAVRRDIAERLVKPMLQFTR
jgi:multicomponent Na+:H+ antiporter subunit E